MYTLENTNVTDQRIDFKNCVTVTAIFDDYVTFSDGSVLSYDHHQECCESNYADFDSLLNTGFSEEVIKSMELEYWDGGFEITVTNMQGKVRYPVNCYSYQNGYYSDTIDVIFKDQTEHTVLKESTCELVLGY